MIEMNNILIISSEFPPGPGGIGNHAYCLAKELLVNDNVHVIAPIRKRFSDSEVNFPSNRISFISNKNKFVRLLNFCIVYKKIILKENINIIILSGIFPLIFINFLNKSGIKIISIIHGHEILQTKNMFRMLLQRTLKLSSKIIAVSKFSKSLLVNRIKDINVDVINNGFSPEIFERSKVKKSVINDICLVTVGSVHRRKGQHNVVKAIPNIKKTFKNISYHIIGIADQINYLESVIDKCSVSDNVIIHGPLSDIEKVDRMIDSDIFIMLSEMQDDGDIEGFGIAIIEANYLGLPAIGAKGCGIEDAIKDNYSGILVNKNSYSDICNAIEKIMSNYEEFSINAKRWAEKHKWDRVILAYNKHIKEIQE